MVPGSFHGHAGGLRMNQMPILLNDKIARRLGPLMSKEAAREMLDGSCRDEDEKAYGRSQFRFTPR